MKHFVWISIALLCACGQDFPPPVEDALAGVEHVDFNFDVKPILADRCFSCHGPDDEARKAGLRLDLAELATGALESGKRAIVPGSPGRSALVSHIISEDPESTMPPPDSKLTLTDTEKAILIRWIDEGAEYKKHWSFIAPAIRDYPEIDQEEVHPIDHFVRAKLASMDLSASPPARPERLLRRLYMDLTGLPPALDDIERFLNSNDPGKYEAVVDRLLASSDCAERLAMEWMDVARYADSHGLHADGWRSMWPWRDYVIDAFQNNMPYDRFVTEQLAGDLISDATRDQIVATAFHRNHPMTAEGGAIDEEFRLEYVADRTNTTATAILGLTMECAKCHDHKYDPISQEDYYRMSAFFNNVRELGMTGDDGNYGPVLQLATARTQERLKEIKGAMMELKKEHRELSAGGGAPPNLKRGLVAHLPMESARKNREGRVVVDKKPEFTSGSDPEVVPGRLGSALKFDEEYDALYLADVGGYDVEDPFSTAVWVNTSKNIKGTTQVIAGNAGDKNNFWRGWDFYLDDQSRVNFRLIHALPDNYIHVRTKNSLPLNTWKHIAFTYGGLGKADDIALFINGASTDAEILRDHLTKNIRTIGPGAQLEVNRPLGIARSYRSFTGENGVFEGMLDELYVYGRKLSPQEVGQLSDPKRQLTNEQLVAHAKFSAQQEGIDRSGIRQLVKESVAIHDSIPEIMIMEDMSSVRPTYVLDRGQYNAPQKEVSAGTPSSILDFADELPKNRLGLAQWLFHDDHPLTARVAVNRYWQMIFGRGLVKSANDFGVQGSLPSHPELLDWLAIYFRDSGWDLKQLLKLIVMSDTYQQSASLTGEHLEKDPDNVFLARSPSYRWPAEMIRDNALAASGLLVKKVGGPSVRPYQPEGLWIDKGTFSHRLLRYQVDSGDDLYRRSLYTFVKRTSPHPAMTIFDAPNRDVCTIKREVTNTPLQALVLLNDPQFIEASRALAERVRQFHPTDIRQQIATAFQLLTSRQASNKEISVLVAAYQEQLENFQETPGSSAALLGVGSLPQISTNMKQVAAMTVVANTIMNSDETYTRR